MSKIKYFTGRVLNIIFEDTSTFFYILRVRLDDDPDSKSYDPLGAAVITVKGNIPGLNVEVGTWFGFEGSWTKHKTHGKQVDITRAPMIQGAWDTKTIVKVLSAHNVGRFTLTLMAERFGDGLAKALENPEQLTEIKGVDKVTAEHIAGRWKTVRALFQTLSFLSQFSLPKTAVNQIWALFGDEAEEVLSTNPWNLVRIQGIDFKVADEIALRLGLDLDDPNRIRGAVLYLAKSQRGMGHLFLTSGELLSLTRQLIKGLTSKQFAVAVKTLRDEKLLIIDRTTKPGVVAIYEPWFHQMEAESTRLLQERVQTANFVDAKERSNYIKMLGNVGPETKKLIESDASDLEGVASQALTEWMNSSKINLSKQQFQGALNALVHPVSVITGLPGTGKTTSLRTIVKVLQDAEVPILLIAPTGIAAKRVMSVAGTEASTIHRAFLAQGINSDDGREATYAGIVGGTKKDATATDGSEEDWGYNEESPHSAQVVIVDESSMVDQHLMYRIMSCTSKTCRVVFVGDAAQLPSVGPGNVLRDLIASEQFPVSNLTEIFRQEDTSDIVLAAHAINSGKMPEPSPSKNDFNFLEMSSDDDIADKLMKSVVRLYNAHKNFQVLSPRHAGTLGVTNLNSRIRDLINPKQAGLQEMRIGKGTIREGDRVMIVRNNYTYEIFNGDVGKIVNLDRSKKEVTVRIWGPPDVSVVLPFKDAASHLRLAYVTTVHKCLAPGTLVETPEGLQAIEDLPEEGEIATPQGFKPYINKVENPEGPLLTLGTDAGSITVTPGHGLQRVGKDSLERTEASALKVGDELVVRAGSYGACEGWSTLEELLEGVEAREDSFGLFSLVGSKEPERLQQHLLLRIGIRSFRKGPELQLTALDLERVKQREPQVSRDHITTIESITSTQGPSYCVEVPDGHQFLQNGFHGWNCQGQEFDYILMPWVNGYRHQLQRNLVYTAITRAKKRVFLFGQKEALQRSVKNNEAVVRNTLFPERLKAPAPPVKIQSKPENDDER